MRLPLRHPPPSADSGPLRCLHLELLADAARGLPLGPAARALTGARGRGRHGNALQWHFGLEAHDAERQLDWEDRIEIKMLTVWRRADGRVVSDKLKVCEAGVDPWHKLANVLWVFVDRCTRVVLGHRFSHRAAELDPWLRPSWGADPHFDQPSMFIESREGSDGSEAPAYYLASGLFLALEWFEGLRPTRFDPASWSTLRRDHAGRPPWLSLATRGQTGPLACPRCGGAIDFDAEAFATRGCVPARHGPTAADGSASPCCLRGHVLVDPSELPSSPVCRRETQFMGIEGRDEDEALWRLSDRVAEPEDHLH